VELTCCHVELTLNDLDATKKFYPMCSDCPCSSSPPRSTSWRFARDRCGFPASFAQLFSLGN
jgi:hypothetical protein